MSNVGDNSANNPPALASPSKARPRRWRRYFGCACLAVLIYVGWWCWSVSGRWGSSKDPAEIRRLTQRLCHIDIPPMFKPVSADGVMLPVGLLAVGANRSLIGTFLGTQKVEYLTEGPVNRVGTPAQLILKETIIFGLDAPDDQKMRSLALDVFGDPKRFMEVMRVETREFNINGGRVAFEFIEGTELRDLNAKLRAISGVFPGHKFHGTRPYIKLQCVIAEERYDEAAFMRMLESIK